mmetsp:Transcript_41668/g.75647  ORF Transcript_41668/g.75647 Transcript_41668/m.75647 type:complete len:657 (-) Transcript_41668:91-2061(-)
MPLGAFTLGTRGSARAPPGYTTAAPSQDNSTPLQVRRGGWVVHTAAAEAGKTPPVEQLQASDAAITAPTVPPALAVKELNLPDRGQSIGGLVRSVEGALADRLAELNARAGQGETSGSCERGPCVPIKEVEQWISSLVTRISTLSDALEVRAKACQQQIRVRDETIRRLHRRLQAVGAELPTESSSQIAGPASNPVASTVPATTRPPRAAPSSHVEPEVTRYSPGAHDEDAAPPQGGVLRVPSSAEMQEAVKAPAPLSLTSSAREKMSPLSLRGLNTATAGGSLNSAREATAPGPLIRDSMSSSGSACLSARRAPEQGQKTLSRRSSTEAYALERQQHVQLRREVASLRNRRDELQGQLRAKDGMVEQLTTMVRELVAQQKGGQHKRSQMGEGTVGYVSSPTTLILNTNTNGNHGCNDHPYLQDVFREDGSLRSLTEEEVVEPGLQATTRPSLVVSTNSAAPERLVGQPQVAGPASPGGDGARSSRGPRLLPGAGTAVVPALMLSSATGPSGCNAVSSTGLMPGQERRTVRMAAGSTAQAGQRQTDAERGRANAAAQGSIGMHTAGMHSASAAAVVAKKDRDRSVGAAPHTPRSKLRDAIGHPTRVAVETPATRRRTTSSARTMGRSTSAEDRTTRRVRDVATLTARSLRRQPDAR